MGLPTGSSADPGVGERLGSYEVLRPLARGGMATVFAVRDVREPNGPPLALKLLLPLGQQEEARTRFRREFRALSKLQHPNVLKVYEWGLRDGRPWYTMELVEGRVLRDEIDAWKSLAPTDRYVRCLAVLVQVTRALFYIHDRGLVHRDITPGNIMVRPDGVVKLMDFGVVKDMGTDLTQVGEVVGTVAYISPEQILGDAIDARADLYSLGAVLYLMLTGKRPFTANTLQGYLEKHLHEVPKPPREVDPHVPANLEAICLRLLAKMPTQRYASASHLLHVLGDVEAMDEVGDRWPPRAVGRVIERARVRDILDEVSAQRVGGAVLTQGPVGMGKTRLLDMVESYARRRGMRVARARCRDADRPFGAFQQIYRELGVEPKNPVLEATFEGVDDGVLRERYPVISAFRDLVVSRAPCVIIIDDAERADLATVELLVYLVRNTLALQKLPVAYLVCEETDAPETSLSRQLVEAGPVTRLHLGPLSQAEIEELVLSVVPDASSAQVLARRLFAEGNGSPAFVGDMLRALIDEGVLRREGSVFALDVDPAELTRSRLPLPASLRGVLQDRLQPLSPDALEVGRALAVSRGRVDLDTLLAVVPFDEERATAALDELTRAEIVREGRDGEADIVELSHHRFRDVLLDALALEDRRARHQRMGEVLERQHRHRHQVVVEDLAWHFEQAGLAPKAYAYLQLTAARHLRRSLFDEALAFLARAEAMEATARPLMLLDDADRRLAELLLDKSQALYHVGDWLHALEEARRAMELAKAVRDARLQSRVAGELGNQLRNRGAIDEAEKALTTALDRATEVGDPALRPMPLYHLGAIRWARGDLEQALVLWKEALETARRTNDERAMGFGYNGLGIHALCRGDASEARRHLEQSAEVFERLGVLGALAIARVNLVEVYLATGVLKKANELADKTVAQAQEMHHPHGEALGLAYRAHVQTEFRNFDDAVENAREALRIIRQLGTSEDEVVALMALVRLEILRKQPLAALEWASQLLPLLEMQDNEGTLGLVEALRAEALAGLGRLEEATAALARNVGGHIWPLAQVRTDLQRGAALRSLGRIDEARETLLHALALAEASGFRLYQLEAHHQLAGTAPDLATRGRHARVATALSRSLAANLSKDDARRFLDVQWGGGGASA